MFRKRKKRLWCEMMYKEGNEDQNDEESNNIREDHSNK